MSDDIDSTAVRRRADAKVALFWQWRNEVLAEKGATDGA